MKKREFVAGIVREAREEGEGIWRMVQEVEDRASMAKLEEACWQLGGSAGRRAMTAALEHLEGRREGMKCRRCGRSMQRQRRRRVYRTLVGDVEVKRWYGYCRGCGESGAPLDEWVEGEGRLSTGLQAKVCEVGTDWGFGRASKKLWRLCRIRVSATAVGRYTRFWAGQSTRAALRPEGWSLEEGETLNLAIDAGKVNTVEHGWRDMKIGYFYDGSQRRRHYVVGIEPAERFASRVRGALARRGAKDTSEVFVRGDGADWIWKLAEKELPGSTQIVDFYHVAAQIATFVRAVFGEDSPKGQGWLEKQLHRLKQIGPQAVLNAVSALPVKKKSHREARRKLVGYITPRIRRMDYPTYIANGWDIGSGPVESACKEIITARLKRGCRWKCRNAVHIANLRALFLSDQWDPFWKMALSA